MTIIKAPAVLLAATIVLSGCVTVSSGTDGPVPPAPAMGQCAPLAELGPAAMSGINAERRAAGLNALAARAELQRAAQVHACDMARTGRMIHQGSDGTRLSQRVRREGARCRMVAENIAMGQRSATEVVRDWQATPGHRANNLHRSFNQGAAAAARGADGRIYWAAVMGQC